MKKLTETPRVFRGLSKNIITPKFLGYYQVGKNFIELSEGRGITNQQIFGVTVRPNSAASELFYSIDDAMEYIEALDVDQRRD